jgi:hypothetical protein
MPLAVLHIRRGGYFLVLLGVLCAGCTGPNYAAARRDFYRGNLVSAEQRLAQEPSGERNMVLFLMERGTVKQAARKHEESTTDWLRAVALCRKLETHSVTEQGASLLINDNTISFRGKPFERTLLRSFLAKNYLARSMWQDAAVEARNIIACQQKLDGYPDDAYSRYMAGLCLELVRDYSNARLQYRKADELCSEVEIDDRGCLRPNNKKESTDAKDAVAGRKASSKHELVCFVAIGRSPTGRQAVYAPVYVPMAPPYAEIYANGRYLGRSYPLTDTGYLVNKTREEQAAAQLAKDVARITAKATIAHQVKQQDAAWGALAELLLFGTEAPDMRRWETLPRWLQVARVPCPPDLDGYEVVFKGSRGGNLKTITVEGPIPQNDQLFISFCRDLPRQPAIPASENRKTSIVKTP